MALLAGSAARYALNKSIQWTMNTGRTRQTPVVVSADDEVDMDDDGGGRHAPGEASGRRGRYGFKPRYAVPLRRPRNDEEAQRLYNHIRTVAFWLDDVPFLAKALPFSVGIDGIVGLIPGGGDLIGFVLGLYQIFLCSLFALPGSIIFHMFLNVLLDFVLGLIPFIGDLLDIAFKCNLRNLRLLEAHLAKTHGKCGAGTFTLYFPPADRFLPPSPTGTPKGSRRSEGKPSWGVFSTRGRRGESDAAAPGSSSTPAPEPPKSPSIPYLDAAMSTVSDYGASAIGAGMTAVGAVASRMPGRHFFGYDRLGPEAELGRRRTAG